jgi:hypothetical protein
VNYFAYQATKEMGASPPNFGGGFAVTCDEHQAVGSANTAGRDRPVAWSSSGACIAQTQRREEA